MIREYKKGDLSSGFVGMRVAVYVNGKSKQRWLGYGLYHESEAKEAAKDLEAKWQKMRIDSKRNTIKSKSNTGIKGLSFTYNVTTKASGKRYAYPAISYTYRQDGKTKIKTWLIDSKALTISKEIWADICLLIKNMRTLRFNTYIKLLENKLNSELYFQQNPYLGNQSNKTN